MLRLLTILLVFAGLSAALAWGPPPSAQAQLATPQGVAVPTATPAFFVRRPPTLTIDLPQLHPGQGPAAPPPAVHIVRPGETTSLIAERYGVDLAELVQLNHLPNPDVLRSGAVLRIPGGVGGEEQLATPESGATAGAPVIAPRGTITERLTLRAQGAPAGNPFYSTTWLTYYGRPKVPVMGILGEHDLDELTNLLHAQARRYDQANGPALKVMPAYHLVYGMATRASGGDGSHLVYLSDEETLAYIERAKEEGFGVILDIQIGARTPLSATAAAFPFLKYENVHLAIDPEFALVYPGQSWPGNPIGFVTGAQINQVQRAMQAYLSENKLPGPRILLVHQFLDEMIRNKDQIDTGFDQVALTISVDGWGPPAGKISKYNDFVSQESSFSSFKLFYRWDEPLLSARQALGEEAYADTQFINTTPNMIIYQ
ncbi:MAG TPA: LysM peptidoglycan-binding domain-containing protein [Caldilineaceae bacterium]|nr:LysM peptidoglycan-binding domain-containing protein [Caldilineaceae bacterium]